jgi:beta-N-acetylhexosaminidase
MGRSSVILVFILLTKIVLAQPMTSEARWVDSTLAQMTLEEKVGQLFVTDFVALYSHEASENYTRIKEQIEKYHVGGLVLAGGAVYDIVVMLNGLQRISKTPLIVAADLEAGLGFWHPWHFVKGRAPDLPKFVSGGGTIFPGNMALGATRNETYAYEVGRITAEEARAVGIQWILAPVVDVNNNPRNPIINTRSFGEDPEAVAGLGVAFIRGCQEAGAIATAKHFPGHGDAEEDSHMKLPVLGFDLAHLESVELVPYQQGIAAGLKSIMSGHIALPKLDPSRRPATLSEPILTGLLRERMKFDGIIVTDGLTMQGVTDKFSAGQAALLAIQAGADCLLVCPDIDAGFASLVEAVKEGKLSEARIDSSVKKILSAKAWLGLDKDRFVDVSSIEKVVGSPASEAMARQISCDAITLLQNKKRAVPISRDKDLKIGVVVLSDASNRELGRDFISSLRGLYRNVSVVHLNASAGTEAVKEALENARHSDVTLLPAFVSIGSWKGPLGLPKPVKRFLRQVASIKRPAIAISFGDPYILCEMPELSATLCAYSGIRLMQLAVVEALRGEIDVRGKLPVTIPSRFKRGDGIDLKKIGTRQ